MNSSTFFHLQLFGRPSVRAEDADSVTGVAVQRRRLALLALLALANERGVSRDKILGYLWPESDIEHARSRLNVAVYALRKALGEDAIVSEAEGLRINKDVVGSDVARFETTLEGDDAETAVAIYSGPFLDGFFIADAPEFERWAELQRDRLGRLYCGALEKLAERSEREGNFDLSAEWWKSRSAYDPYDSRVALRLMNALDASGNTAAALQHALMHAKRLKDDFGVEAPAELKDATARLRTRHTAVEEWAFVRNDVEHVRAPRDDSGSRSPANHSTSDRPQHDLTSRGGIASAGHYHDVSILWQNRRYALLAGILILTGSVASMGVPTHEAREIRGLSRPQTASFSGQTNNVGKSVLTARREAEDFYYQGRYLTTATQNATGFGEALALYSKAVERDPTFAKAYAGMADAYNYMENPREAKASALKALSLDSTNAEALNALAYVYGFYEHHWLDADRAVERATRLSPRYTLAHLRRANINAVLGRRDVALASLDKARAIEPESWTVLYNRGFVASALGMNDEAIKHLEAAFTLAPQRNEARAALAWEYWGAGRKDAAAALFRNAGDPTDAAMLSGDTTQLRSLIQRFETDSTTLPACRAAAIYLELGQKDAAFTQLKRAVGQTRLLPLMIRFPPFVSVKDDPRYGELESELGMR